MDGPGQERVRVRVRDRVRVRVRVRDKFRDKFKLSGLRESLLHRPLQTSHLINDCKLDGRYNSHPNIG